MATLDLDPNFVKALRLLHSKAKDSSAQLRAMVDEAITGKKGHKLKPVTSETDAPEPKKAKYDTPSPSKEEKKEKDRDKERSYKREREKREQEKERERQEKERQREIEREKERLAQQQQQEELESDESTEEYDKPLGTDNTDDFAFELGVCCQVCSKFDITPKNNLVECQECHYLYHQECHKPPVVGNITDPRFVWYCNKCSKTMKKHMQSQKQTKSKPAPSSSSSKEHAPSTKAEPLTLAQAFQRTEKKMPAKDNQSSSQPFKGLAGLAANLSKVTTKAESKALLTGWKTEPVKPGHKDKDTSDKPSRSEKSSKEGKDKSSSSSSKSGSGSGGSSSGGSSSGGNGSKQPSMSGSTMASANKRLQLMKKSAAAKQAEKRVHIK